MRIVLDSNILFSALIKDSKSRQLILDYEGRFLFPYFIFDELNGHKFELMKKSGLDEKQFFLVFDALLKKVEVVTKETLIVHRTKAKQIIDKIDSDDVVFIACVLAYSGSILWSNDKKLKKQEKVLVYNTKEIEKVLSE